VLSVNADSRRQRLPKLKTLAGPNSKNFSPLLDPTTQFRLPDFSVLNPSDYFNSHSHIIRSGVMGSWDVYCAICGSCFGGAQVKKRSTKSRGEQQQTGTGTSAPDEAAGENEGGDEDSNSEDEECCYDGDVIDEKDLEWLGKLRVLGFNPDAAGIHKCVAALLRLPCDNGLMGFIGPSSLGLEATGTT
jgi:hypothetical protein